MLLVYHRRRDAFGMRARLTTLSGGSSWDQDVCLGKLIVEELCLRPVRPKRASSREPKASPGSLRHSLCYAGLGLCTASSPCCHGLTNAGGRSPRPRALRFPSPRRLGPQTRSPTCASDPDCDSPLARPSPPTCNLQPASILVIPQPRDGEPLRQKPARAPCASRRNMHEREDAGSFLPPPLDFRLMSGYPAEFARL